MIGGAELQPQSRDSWCESWNESIEQVGRDINALREAQGLSLQAVHMATKVPVYHLLSLEAGEVSKLPDAIFVRGFLKKICQFLGPDGEALMAKLPEPQLPPLAMPTRRVNQPWQGSSLHVSHLYLGYGVLLAGAMGGLAWTDQNAQLGQEYLGKATEQSNPSQSEGINPMDALAIQNSLAAQSIAAPTLQAPEFGL